MATQSTTGITGPGVTPISAINDLANTTRNLTATVAAQGSLIPILYGERDVPGLVFAVGYISGDLVIGYLWCVGEVQAIDALYLNDAAVPGAGVTVTHYTGTSTQTADPTLQTAIAGYNDRMRVPLPGGSFLGLAYTVVRIDAGVLTGFPRARAVIRGRKVYDPRTLTTAYSDNPALALYDLITNTSFGLGRVCTGADDVADWCDELLGGIGGAFRARIGLYIAQGRRAEEYIDLLCEYAECFQVYDGATIKLIPDSPVDLTSVPVVGPESIIQNTLTLNAESSSDTPTEVEFQYTEEPTTASQPWSLVSIVVQMPGVDEGEIQRIPTSMTMEGVTREIEASNKALARLYKLQNRITATWQTVDKGVINQRGDVVQLTHAPRGIDMPVRIMDVNLIAPGRYQVSAIRYDESHYPSDIVLPEDEGIVPVGAIGMLIGTTVPDGWELFSSADGKYIIGAGNLYTPGDTGGSSSIGVLTGTSGNGGGHGGDDLDVFLPLPGGSPAGYFYPDVSTGPDLDGTHSHSYSTTATTENFLKRNNTLVRKITSDGIVVPASVRVFGLQNTSTTSTKNTSFVNRFLVASASSSNSGASTQTISGSLASTSDGVHTHYDAFFNTYDPFGIGDATQCKFHEQSLGDHSHTVSFTCTQNIKRQQLCCFDSPVDFAVTPGIIFMWSGSIASIPADFVLCDGLNGTPDMRDRFVQFASTTPVAAAGDNTISISGTSSSVGHTHDFGVWAAAPYGGKRASHSGTVFHSHETTASHAFTPPYYALAFIMYSPGA